MSRTIINLIFLLISFTFFSCTKEEQGGDTLAPFIVLNGDNPVWLRVGDAYVDAGAKAWDVTETGDTISINTSLEVNSNLNTSIIGVYFVRYNVSDDTGNKAEEASRKVYVNEF